MKRLVALLLLTCSTLLLCSTAAAQDQTWLNDRKYREGAGFRVGNFELHPGIGADFGYDSNYYRRHSSEDPVGSLRIRVSPSFSVSTLGPQRRGRFGRSVDSDHLRQTGLTERGSGRDSQDEGGQEIVRLRRFCPKKPGSGEYWQRSRHLNDHLGTHAPRCFSSLGKAPHNPPHTHLLA